MGEFSGQTVKANPAQLELRTAELIVKSAFGGTVNGVYVDPAAPDIAYACAGRRLVILNVADPENLIELGSIDLKQVGNIDCIGDVLNVAVRDDYAYVGMGRFVIVDVADPSDPQIVWRNTEAGVTAAYQVRLYGNVAYVRNHDDLHTYDISNPQSPIYKGRAILWTPNIADFVIAGNLMYILYDAWDEESAAGLKIADLTDPFSLEVLGDLRVPHLVSGEDGKAIDVEGQYVYITIEAWSGLDDRFAVIDVSDPQAPFVVGTHVGGFTLPKDVAVKDGLAYVSDYSGSTSPNGAPSVLRIFDVATDPNTPVQVGTYETHAGIRGIEIVGDRAYVFDDGEGLIILDISNPLGRGVTRLGNWHSPAEMLKMDKVGDLLYVTDKWNGITILDVAQPSSPVLVGVYQTDPDGVDNWGIEVRDGLAYLSAGFAGVDIVDVSQPANPTRVGNFPFDVNEWSVGLELDGNIAHVGQGVIGSTVHYMVNLDVSDPQNVVELGSVLLGSPPRTIDTSPAGVACLAQYATDGGLLTNVDTAIPSSPSVVFSGKPGGVDLVRDGDVLYIANDDWDSAGGLYVYSVADPSEPVELGRFATRSAYGIAVQDSVAYLLAKDPANGNQESLFVLDVSDPTEPVALAKTVVRAARHILVDGRYAYVTTIAKGLVIIEVDLPTPPADPLGDMIR